jgi:hypothetical protein
MNETCRQGHPLVEGNLGRRKNGSRFCRACERARAKKAYAALRADRRLAETVLLDGKVVSTVWLGLDHARHGAPLIFETMVFPSQEDFTDLDVARYTTRAEAMAGHEDMVEKWTRMMVERRVP